LVTVRLLGLGEGRGEGTRVKRGWGKHGGRAPNFNIRATNCQDYFDKSAMMHTPTPTKLDSILKNIRPYQYSLS
jgi:hypothetical protein